MKATNRRATCIAVALALALTGCNGNDDDTSEQTTSTADDVDDTSTTTETTGTHPDAELDRVAHTWSQAWTLAGDASSTPDTLAEVATPEVAARLVDTLHLGADDLGDAFTGRHVTNHPVVEDNDDGTFTINDCLLISPPTTPAEANWYSGTIETINGDLTITAVNPEVAIGCIPAEIADQVYEVWDRYWELQAEGVRPGNSEFESMITGDYETFVLPLLESDANDGRVFREFDTQHPEIVDFRADFVSVSSCTDASTETGYYDPTTGDRLPTDVPEAGSGTRNGYELQFTRVDGDWRISSRGGGTDSNCVQAPTDLAIPEVG